MAVRAVVDVRDLGPHNHGVLLAQGAGQREGSREGDAGFHLVHVLVLALHPRRALHAGIPVRAVGIHGGGIKPAAEATVSPWLRYVRAAFLDSSEDFSMLSGSARSSRPTANEHRVHGGGELSKVVESAGQQSLSVLDTRARTRTHTQDKSKQPSCHLNHKPPARRVEQVPGKYLNHPAALRAQDRPPRQQVEVASRSGSSRRSAPKP